MKAIKFPTYMKTNNSVLSTTKDVSYLYDNIYSIVKTLGADIMKSSSRPSFTAVFWKDVEYTKIKLSIYSGTIDDFNSENLTVEIMFREGSNFLYKEYFSNITKIGIEKGLFVVPKINGRKFIEFYEGDNDVKRGIDIFFDMIESEYSDIKSKASISLYTIYKNSNDEEKKMIIENKRFLPSLKILLTSYEKSKYLDLISATVAVKFIADSGVYIDVSIINEQKGIMWEEAKRNARKIQGK
jgi:hypothetical protein